ncbi:hypothetical protein BDP27DRAFT_1325712 [Rhodocollybia butyracea]|uniref:Uncharacterized protein n=1 Tax=Rhodocollybia butyracea TaxID=206335 RepID=A0A9P5U7Y2_9AGAR|nr:hypothetical protein BDP27DRAFT_1325712 [Rhodocollybia butyracea]
MHTPRNSGNGNGTNRSSSSTESSESSGTSKEAMTRASEMNRHFSISSKNIEVDLEDDEDDDDTDTDTLCGPDHQHSTTLRTAADIHPAHDDRDFTSSPSSESYTPSSNSNRSSGIFQRIKRRYTLPSPMPSPMTSAMSGVPNRARSQTLNLEERAPPYPPRSSKSRSLWSVVSLSRSSSKRSNSSIGRGGIVAEMMDEDDRSWV